MVMVFLNWRKSANLNFSHRIYSHCFTHKVPHMGMHVLYCNRGWNLYPYIGLDLQRLGESFGLV